MEAGLLGDGGRREGGREGGKASEFARRVERVSERVFLPQRGDRKRDVTAEERRGEDEDAGCESGAVEAPRCAPLLGMRVTRARRRRAETRART